MLSSFLNTASRIGSSVRRARFTKPSYLLSSRAIFEARENIKNTLGLFIFDLPDPNQDLWVQKRSSETFTLFPKLPMELRLMIWNLSLPEGQLIDVDITINELLFGALGRSRRPFPDTLYVNNESRRETLRHYTLFLPCDLPEEHPLEIFGHGWEDLEERAFNRGLHRGWPFYMSPRRDTLFFVQDILFENDLQRFDKFFPNTIHKVDTLVIDYSQWEYEQEYPSSELLFKGLRKLFIVQGDRLDVHRSGEEWEFKRLELLQKMEELKLEDQSRSVPEIVILPSQEIYRSIWWDN